MRKFRHIYSGMIATFCDRGYYVVEQSMAILPPILFIDSKDWEEIKECTCPKCNGTGKVIQSQVNINKEDTYNISSIIHIRSNSILTRESSSILANIRFEVGYDEIVNENNTDRYEIYSIVRWSDKQVIKVGDRFAEPLYCNLKDWNLITYISLEGGIPFIFTKYGSFPYTQIQMRDPYPVNE